MSLLDDLAGAATRRFARLATDVVVRRPAAWRLLRRPLGWRFERLAPHWDTMQSPDGLAPYEAALFAIANPPRRALDLGTGTGAGALAIARRFPEAEVIGVDLAAGMVEAAERKLPPELGGRVRFEVADAASLPFADGSFDLVAHANMIPFFDELERVLASGGYALFGFSGGRQTPIYVEPERLRRELARRGFANFTEFAAARGTSLLARKGEPH